MTNARVMQVATSLNSALANYHIGMIIAFAGSTAPNGWFICDGREVSRTEYSRLFTLIGVTYGNGNGTTTFNIPDLRECVLVGSGESTRSAIATHDVYNVGEFKDDQFQGHFHWLTGSGTYEAGGNGVGGMKPDYSGARKENGMGLPQGYGEDTYLNLGEPRYGSTTHSKQLGVNYIIKY